VHIICFAIPLPKHYSFTASPIRSYRRLYRRNRINKNGHSAVWAYKEGGGTIEDNNLRGNAKGAWHIPRQRAESQTRPQQGVTRPQSRGEIRQDSVRTPN